MKKILSLLLVITLVLSLFACADGSKETGSDTNKQDPAASTVTPPAQTPSTGAATGNTTKPSETKPDTTKPDAGPSLENDIHSKLSYTDTNGELKFYKEDVVATFGDLQLTNTQLQIYYWSEVYGFLNNYYYYLSYFGLDYTKPLDTQACSFDKTLSWQQYFLQNAIEVWKSNIALAELARKEGFTLPENYQNDLDGLAEKLQLQATQGAYDSVDAMLQASFGSCVTLADYQAYMEVYYMGYAYFEARCAQIDPTMEEIEDYYAANADNLAEAGIKKDGSYTIDVRHILVLIDNVVAEMGGGATTDAHWTACQEAAQEIYDEYLGGDLTEARFGELANKYSDDQNGNVTNGGIYTGVKPGDMVESFNDWCFDENRQVGDTGLVKSPYGYHVMFFVGRAEAWIAQTREMMVSEIANQIVQEAIALANLQIDYSNILLAEVKM